MLSHTVHTDVQGRGPDSNMAVSSTQNGYFEEIRTPQTELRLRNNEPPNRALQHGKS